MFKKITFAVMITGLSACAVKTTAVPIGGSKADGTIELGFQYGAFVKPEVDWNQAQNAAISRCKAWGYGSAEPFGGIQTNCVSWSGQLCATYRASITYQCTDAKPLPARNPPQPAT